MPITINGSGSVTGISSGGLPDDCITTADIAANAVTTAKLGTSEASGLAKAWVNFNGTGTVAIRASFNVSSITDVGAGTYTVNFTTALADANFVPLSTNGQNAFSNETSNTLYNRTTTSVALVHFEANATYDVQDIYVAIFR